MFNAVLKYKFTSWTLLNTGTLVQTGMLTPPSLLSGFRENWTHQGIEYQGEKIRTADSCVLTLRLGATIFVARSTITVQGAKILMGGTTSMSSWK